MLTGGETDVEGAFRVEYTPGPRVPPRLLLPRAVAAGRSSATWAARASRRTTFTVAPTPPPDIDVAAWKASVATIRAWEPVALGLTHFGEARAGATRPRASRPLTLRSSLRPSTTRPASWPRWSERVRAGCGEDADAMIQATPLDQLHMGLARWRKKFG